MSSRTHAGRRFLFSDVSFADLWRAARYHQLGGREGIPGQLDVAHASRFAPNAQALVVEANDDAVAPSFRQRAA